MTHHIEPDVVTSVSFFNCVRNIVRIVFYKIECQERFSSIRVEGNNCEFSGFDTIKSRFLVLSCLEDRLKDIGDVYRESLVLLLFSSK
jgi:hypothetical protein